jgi:hypothetical protein
MLVLNGGDVVAVLDNQTNPKAPSMNGDESSNLAQLLKRAQAGDVSVLGALRQVLSDNPDLWQGYGDLAAQAEAALIRLAAGRDLLLTEALLRKLAALKQELGGNSPTPLERLLIERVTACWLQVAYYDALAAQAQRSSPERVKMLQGQQDAAHRRQLSAIKTLATVRKLVRPPLSPVDVATRLDGDRPRVRLHKAAVGVPVEN